MYLVIEIPLMLTDTKKLLCFGQKDGKCTALAKFTLHLDIATDKSQNLVHDGKSKAVAFARVGFVPLVEFVENVSLSFRVHATTIVLDGYGNFVANVRCNDVNFGIARAKFDGICQNVYPHL